MKVEFKKSFLKDVKRLSAANKKHVSKVIENVKAAKSLRDIDHLTQLTPHYYRIRGGSVRIGIYHDNGIVYFTVVGNRGDIYKRFPPK